MTLKCLVIMPFRPDFDAVYKCVQSAAQEALPGDSVDCYWLKDVRAAGKITDDIVNGIQESAFCIASPPTIAAALALQSPSICFSDVRRAKEPANADFSAG